MPPAHLDEVRETVVKRVPQRGGIPIALHISLFEGLCHGGKLSLLLVRSISVCSHLAVESLRVGWVHSWPDCSVRAGRMAGLNPKATTLKQSRNEQSSWFIKRSWGQEPGSQSRLQTNPTRSRQKGSPGK